MDVAGGNSFLVSRFKAWQELLLCNVGDPVADELIDLIPVRLLQGGKTTHIKWLQEVR